MKFIHLSDLHIGKRVNEFSMLEDQKDILAKILHVIAERDLDAVVLAGDIYDKSVPAAEAVQVFDWFLTQLARMGLSVLIVSGNHDSAERLAFGAELMENSRIFLSPVYDGHVSKVMLQDEWGSVSFYLLPFIKPAMVRHAFPEEEIASYEDAMKAAIAHMGVDASGRNVLVAHQFVTGAKRCDSEETNVGGVDQVSASNFDDFDYAALGHIHSPQQVGRDSVRYCGSPLKYSFSEAEQEKSVTIVTMKEKGNMTLEMISLKPKHDMRRIKGTYLELTSRDFYQTVDKNDYIHITLTDEEDIMDGMQKLRYYYPNLMTLSYDNKRTREEHVFGTEEAVEQKSEMELVMEFYEQQNNQPMSERQKSFMWELLGTVKMEET